MSEETVKYPVNSGAARQIYGSSSLRTSGNNKQSKRRKNNNHATTSTTRQPSYEDFEDYDDRYPHGILVHEPHPVPPPFDPSFGSFRAIGGGVIGGVRVPGIEDSIYGSRKHGERHGDVEDNWKTWDRFDTKPEHGEHGSSNYAVMHPEGDLMHMPNSGAHMVDDDADSDDRIDEQPCTLGCLNSEFLCPHSCQCVPKFTRVHFLKNF